jgi:glycosyltransferase involved in cell wall biosynthesis
VKTFVKTLTTGYANLCDLVIAPSEAVKHVLKERGVTTPTQVIPTGIDVEAFRDGDGQGCRQTYEIPSDSFVVGHVGRLASEKNLLFLIDSVTRFLNEHSKARFLVVGDGPQREEIEQHVSSKKIADRVIFTGVLKDQALIDAYHAMDVFVFSSTTETQGMVLAEAMAAGLPVVALKASGVTDILKDGKNGYMIDSENVDLFADKIITCFESSEQTWKEMKLAAKETANGLSIDSCANQVLEQYEQLRQNTTQLREKNEAIWKTAMDLLKAEWDIFCNYINAAGSLIYSTESEQD